MNVPKRHHYLPQFYLNGFCRDGELWVHDQETNETRVQTPVNTGVRQYYYRFEYDDGEESFEVEELLGELETDAAPVIAKLRRQETINTEEGQKLALFLGTLLGRTPSAQKSHDKTMDALMRARQKRVFPTPESLRAFFEGNPALAESVGDDVDFDALCNFIQGDEYYIDFHRNESIKAMVLLADDVARGYANLDWHPLRPSNEGESFITTDTPIIHAFKEAPEFARLGPGELPAGVQVVVPLAHDCLLVMEDNASASTFVGIDDETVWHFNLTLAAAADRFIIGRDKALVEDVTAGASKEQSVLRNFDEALEIVLQIDAEGEDV